MADVLTTKEINDLLDALIKEEHQDKEDFKKDFSVLGRMERDAVDKIRTAFDKGYEQGYKAGVASHLLEKQDEIRVGDEVYLVDKCHPRVVTCITKKIDGENPAAVQFAESGKWVVDDVTELHKTGRHFNQIEEVLKALKEG